MGVITIFQHDNIFKAIESGIFTESVSTHLADKEILKEYIVSVDIGDDGITIHAVSDSAENVKSRQLETGDLNTSGCGGRI